ncbi:MAG TPA: hypothetical protein VHP83_20325 [Aggregatilineaceae bacterium]|nr:hypothetical protein [Aggregatilineaceae bacterium]
MSKLALLFALVLLFVLPVAAAQITSDPVIINIDSDLWEWQAENQPLIQMTTWGMNERPLLSPDGTKAAYLSGATVFKEWLQTITGGTGGYWPPTNIWVLDIATGQTFRIADQPADAVFDGPNDPGKYVLRCEPSWSPDSQQIAWVELQVDTLTSTDENLRGIIQIAVYDFASETTRILDSYPITWDVAGIDYYSVEWGRPGIVVTSRASGFDLEDFRLYDPSGSLITQYQLAEDAPSGYWMTWIEYEGEDYLLDLYQLDKGVWMKWRTGEVEAMPGVPEMVSATAPDGASFFKSGGVWMMALPRLAPSEMEEHAHPYGISRDGQRVLFSREVKDPTTGYFEEAFIVQSGGQQIEIGRYRNVDPVWGPVIWRIRPE